METNECTTMRVSGVEQRTALASPLRLEILGLFTNFEPMSIADMAGLMGRRAGSLYHHVGILEKTGLLRRTGTRPKGKRYEALFLPAAHRIELEAEQEDADAMEHVVRTLSTAFRMAERDLKAALRRDDCVVEGRQRNFHATRLHLRASPELLAGINENLRAIEKLVTDDIAARRDAGPDDQHLSLTLALLPLKGRGRAETDRGDRDADPDD